MAILSSPSVPVRPVSTPVLISLANPTLVEGTINITSVTQSPPALTLSGQGAGFFVSNDNGTWAIHLQPTSTQAYPVIYTLTLSPPTGFAFAEPIGQLSLVGQEDGFLLNSPTLQMYKGDDSLFQTYNLALQFLNESNGQTFWVGDPTIVFEPPS